MKTLIATATLTVMFLSAGAFAGNDASSTSTLVAKSQNTNVTVISKNGQWPAKGQISFDACSVRRCLEA